ncbi:MAG: DNA primase [Deltaproteobacteria bacterium]|nr:DNA primase [Deltaproteobacteria bacterium]
MRDAQLRQTIQARAVEIIGTFVRLHVHGKNQVGLCPFHADTRPSLSVNAEKGLFHCFGCGVGGDSLTFLMRRKGLTFPEALEEATRLLGLPSPARPHDAGPARLAHAAECATQLFARWLWQAEGEPGQRYLRQRGIHQDTAQTFRLGYHPEHPTALLRALAAHGVSAEEAGALGLATRKGGQWVGCGRGRLIFPITDGWGQVRGFGARALRDHGPKYVNSPDSPLFHKGHLLYGLAQARAALPTRKDALVVEGYLDVLTLHQAGLTATVSPLSTTLSSVQLMTLRSFVARVVLLFDGDPAGQVAMTRVFVPAEESGVPVAVVTLPREHDPDSYVRVHGGPALEALVAQASPLGEYVVRQLAAQYPQERAGREAVTLAERISHPVRQLTFLQQAETYLQFPPGSLSEVMGLGHAARHRLEEILVELVLTIPEVRERLRGVTLPLRDPRLREVVARALRESEADERLERRA